MKWRDRRKSSNVGKSTSSRSSSPFGSSGRGMSIPMGGGIGGIVIVIILFFLTRGFGGLDSPGQSPGVVDGNNDYQQDSQYQELDTELEQFLAVVLADSEDVWNAIFADAGLSYEEPMLILYDGTVNTACGQGSSQMGPFYCPADERVYMDPTFYYELRDKHDAPGDFALAYVLAHEVGHHVQYLLGITEQIFDLKARMPEEEFNRYLVRLELQADYLAGVFAHYADDKDYLDVGDIEEAMNAAAAVGDDTIQSKAWGMVVPDKFTHGTAAQRQSWFNRGYQYGDLAHGDTFSESIEQLT
ncbi:MAG: metalloprotease [Ruminococcaceae bacterium]|nr:metalloprotease [Oscillospiraceae bacterium]